VSAVAVVRVDVRDLRAVLWPLPLRAIPRVQLERAEPGAQIEHIVAENGDRGNPQRLILARGLYYCSYPPIASLYLARVFTVL